MSALDNPLLDKSRILSLGERGSFVLRILFQNVKSFLLPESLCHDWSSGTLHSINIPILSMVSILCLTIVYQNCNLGRQKIKRWMGRIWNGKLIEQEFLLIWAAMTYFPISNIVPVGFIRAERCLYNLLPIYAWLLSNGLHKLEVAYAIRSNIKPFTKMIKHLCIGILMIKSWSRSFDWRDDFSLSLKATEAGSIKSRINLASLLPDKHFDKLEMNNQFQRLKVGIGLIESVKYRNAKAGLKIVTSSLISNSLILKP